MSLEEYEQRQAEYEAALMRARTERMAREAAYLASVRRRMPRIARVLTERYRAVLPDGVRFEWTPLD